MPFKFDGVLTELETVLKDGSPDTWTVADLDANLTNTLTIWLAYELLSVSRSFEGQALADGYVAVDFTLTLNAPQKDGALASAELTKALPDLVTVLDSTPDLVWGDIERQRGQAGDLWFRIPVSLIATYAKD